MREAPKRTNNPADEPLHPELFRVIDNMEHVIVGKRTVIVKLVCAVLAQGHVLLDDVPGVGKTTLAKALAATLDLQYARIQFTPDLLPTDVTGVNIYNPAQNAFVFQPGPVFSNLLLADEINRTSPRTQSALLEVMEENQVTVDGVAHRLAPPFMVLATQNPIEYEGTFPLPESQLDRFLFRLTLGYPSVEEETAMLERVAHIHPLSQLHPVLTQERLIALIEAVTAVHMSGSLRQYIAQLAVQTREHPRVYLGMSPRATISLQRAAQAWAFLHGRDFVIPDDIQSLLLDVAAHRIILKGGHRHQQIAAAQDVLRDVLKQTPIPEPERRER
ncbi:MoxR family ATPase [Sulfobacillus sp. hq2]|uniref:AAA family ATPase n=1 Tax=Sulfobacillus sp. hq2 TaxID=2039167 RepID=UPI001FA8CB52|nr:MoxR family ATPase [Sulfobacillus sp. hq2]